MVVVLEVASSAREHREAVDAGPIVAGRLRPAVHVTRVATHLPEGSRRDPKGSEGIRQDQKASDRRHPNGSAGKGEPLEVGAHRVVRAGEVPRRRPLVAQRAVGREVVEAVARVPPLLVALLRRISMPGPVGQ